MLSLLDILYFLANKIFYYPINKGQAKVLIIIVHPVVSLIQRYKYVALKFMLVWGCTILPSRLQFKFKKRSPNWGPRNLQKECAHPNGINTYTLEREKYSLSHWLDTEVISNWGYFWFHLHYWKGKGPFYLTPISYRGADMEKCYLGYFYTSRK